MPPLPVPLNALRAFEAVARHLGIRPAAEELGVTPSAVSHQLRQLEESLGVELLRRNGQRLELTSAGEALAPDLTAGFSRITTAVGKLKSEGKSGPLRVSVLPTFAVQWLSPRLASYPFERPGYELLISTTQEMVELGTGTHDAAIRYGKGVWPGLVAHKLFTENDALLGPPGLLPDDEAASRRQLARTHLFVSRNRHPNFLEWNATLSGGPITPASVVIVDSAGLGLRAAIDGAGVTLAGAEMAAFDITAGRLKMVFGHTMIHGSSYYLVYPPALERDRRLKNVRAWLMAQIAAAQQVTAGRG
ncbi:LysR substrate-binding domain-containing protein [Rhizobium sp. LjRoot30]|uniref:LysR substrate-binding domain-containing protein n=1 Tax=Rhizobium sp. LjRoot30 TaxID=3342320 RepID=UPI003ECF2A86